MRKAERSSDCTYVCISTLVPFEGKKKGKRDGMHGEGVGGKKNQQQQISLSTSNVCLLNKLGVLITNVLAKLKKQERKVIYR